MELLLLLLFGLVQLFFGYAFFRILIVLGGAVLGFYLGPDVYFSLTGQPPGSGVALVSALIVGGIFAALAWFAVRALLFLWGFLIGFWAMAGAGQELVPALVVGVAAGVLVAIFQRALIIAFTSLSGASLVATAGLALLGGWVGGTGVPAVPQPRLGLGQELLTLHGFELASREPWFVVLVLALAVIGAGVQFGRTGRAL